MVYSIRVVPSCHHKQALSDFDGAIRSCFECFSNLRPDDTQWEQATLSTRSGGLGLRSLERHNSAAYIASRSSCISLCQHLDPEHVPEWSIPSSIDQTCLEHYNSLVQSEQRVAQNISEPLSQRTLSETLDKASVLSLLNPATSTTSQRAHLRLVSVAGAGSWLHCPPTTSSGNAVNPQLYSVMLQRRLRMPVFENDDFCSLCSGIMDSYGDHALTCPCGGDRTKRHNLIRNQTHRAALRAGFKSAELEKPGLLRPRPCIAGSPEDGSTPSGDTDNSDQRRPADVYIPRWRRGCPIALDFAVTSGLREEFIAISEQDPQQAVLQYEGFKCAFLNTQQQCIEEGFTFTPVVMEAVGGGIGPQGAAVIAELAKSTASASGESADNCAVSIMQSLQITLHRENARALLRRN